MASFTIRLSDGSTTGSAVAAFDRVLADPSLSFRHPRLGYLVDHAYIARLIGGR